MQAIINMLNIVAYTSKDILLNLTKKITTRLLIKACKYNFYKCIHLLNYLEIDIENELLNRLMHCAVENDSLNFITALMQHGAAIDQPNEKGETVWEIALEKTNLKLIMVLLKLKSYDEDIAAKALLKEAKNNKSFRYLERFIALGADINKQDHNGNSLLHFAAKYNDIGAMQTLIKNNANLSPRNKNGEMPIHYAAKYHCSYGTEDYPDGALQLLIKHGAITNAKNFAGETPLHASVYNVPRLIDSGEPSVALINHNLNTLIDNNADVNIDNNKRQSLLHAAVIARNVTAVIYLSSRNLVDINGADILNCTPLHLAIYNMAGYDIVRTLITFGAQVLAKDIFGNIPLHYFTRIPANRSISSSNNDTVQDQLKILRSLSESVSIKEQLMTLNNNRQTPLHCIIAENGNILLIKKLFNTLTTIQKKQLINAIDNNGNTLLHTACEINIDNLYKEKHKGKLAKAMQALDRNALEIVTFLVEQGCNVYTLNKYAETPLDIAKEYSTPGIVEILQKCHKLPDIRQAPIAMMFARPQAETARGDVTRSRNNTWLNSSSVTTNPKLF